MSARFSIAFIVISVVAAMLMIEDYLSDKDINKVDAKTLELGKINSPRAATINPLFLNEKVTSQTTSSQKEMSHPPLKNDKTIQPASDAIKSTMEEKPEHKNVKDIEAEKQTENKNQKSISDEEAKKVIPYPFVHALSIFEPEDRINYQKFSDANESDDWDLKMQAQLIDAIYSNPQSPALTLDSVSCKAHICELRIFAINNTAWPLVFADMQLTPWWSFKNSFSIYEFGIQENFKIKTIYFVLLMRTE